MRWWQGLDPVDKFGAVVITAFCLLLLVTLVGAVVSPR